MTFLRRFLRVLNGVTGVRALRDEKGGGDFLSFCLYYNILSNFLLYIA